MAGNSIDIKLTAGLDVQKSVAQINSEIQKIEGQLKKLKLQAKLDGKTSAELQKQISALNKQKQNLYVSLKLKKNDLKKQYKQVTAQLQAQPINIDVNTSNAQKQVTGLNNTVRSTRSETVTLGNSITKTLNNMGLVVSAQTALQTIRRAAQEATEAVKEYDKYVTNLSVINGSSREDANKIIADLSEKSFDFKVDISDLEGAYETLLRTGKAAGELDDYLKSTVYLSKIGFEDMDTSASNLVTIGNAFKLQSDEIENVVSKLVSLDTASNTVAGKLSTALAKTAQNAQLAGVNIDELGAIISGLRDTAGKTEDEIATSLNSMFSRLYNVKLGKYEIELEDGTTENISESINNVERMLKTVGMSIRTSKGDFKEVTEIINDLVDNWDKFNDVQKSGIAFNIAGTHHKNTFMSMIESWNRINELQELSANSANEAQNKYDNYLSSIEAKSAALSTAMKDLYNNLMPNGFVGNITDATTGLTKFVDEYQVLQTVIKSAAFYALAKGIVSAKNGLTGMVTDIKNVSYAMKLASNITSLSSQEFANLQSVASMLSDKQLKLILSTNNLTYADKLNIVQTNNMTRAEAEQKLATLGITQANNQATASTFSLSGAFKSLFAVIAANPIFALTMAFTALVTIYQTVQRKQEELRQSISDTAQKAKEQTDNLNDLIKSYEKFADKVSYTTKEKEQLKSIQDKLSESYHTEVDDIDLVNGKYDEEIEKLRQLKKEKLADAELSLVAEREQAAKESRYDNLGGTKRFLLSPDWFGSEDDYNKIAKEFEGKIGRNFTNDIAWAAKAIGYDSQFYFWGDAEDRVEQIQTAMSILEDYGYANLGIYSELNKQLSEYQSYVDTENEAINNLADNIFQQYELDNPYNEVGQDSYLAWKDGLLSIAGDDKDLKSALLNLAEKQFPDYEKFFENREIAYRTFGVENVSDARGGEIKTFINSLSDEDLEAAINIPDLFKNGLDNATALIEAWKNDPKNKIVDTEAEMTSLEKLQKSIEDTSKKTSVIKSAMEEMSDTGYISADTYSQLVELGGNFTKCLEIQDGRLVLNVEKLKDLEAQQYKNIIAENEETLSTLKLAKSRMLLYGIKNQSDYNMLNEIEERIKTLEEENGLASTLIDEIYKAGSDTGSGGSSKPKQVTDYEKWVAQQEHEIAMGRLKEDEAYYSEKLKRAEKAYNGLTEYEQNLWKVQEEVYNGRKKLAEEAFDNEHDLFEKRVDELEEYADKLSETSVTSDGTELTTQEKYREIVSVYEEIRYAIEDEINRIVQAGVEGHEDLLKELEKQSEEYSDKIADTFKSAVEAEKSLLEKAKGDKSSEYDDKIDKVKEQQEAAQKAADAEIEAIQTKIDNLQKVNEEKQREYDIEKARQDLEKVKKQRTRMVYGADGRKGYETDPDAINEAQKSLDNLLLEKQINSLENQKTVLEEMRDKESESYDTLIADIESQKEQSERQFDSLLQYLDNYLNPTGDTSNADVWSAIAKTEGAKFESGKWYDKDGNVIDIDGLYSTLEKDNGEKIDISVVTNSDTKQNTAETNTDTANAKKSFDIVAELLKKFKAPQEVIDKYLKGDLNGFMTSYMKSAVVSPQFGKQTDLQSGVEEYKIANQNSTNNFTIGDIHIHEPIGDSEGLAKCILSNLHNEMIQALHKNTNR